MFEKNSKQTTFLPGLSFYYLLTISLPVISKMPVSNVAAMMMTSLMAAVVMAMPRLS